MKLQDNTIQWNVMQWKDHRGQPKTNGNQRQMSTKNKCQPKTSVNQKQMSTTNTQLNPTEPNITQLNPTQLNPMVVTLR